MSAMAEAEAVPGPKLGVWNSVQTSPQQAGMQALGPSLLLPQVCTGRKLGSGVRAGKAILGDVAHGGLHHQLEMLILLKLLKIIFNWFYDLPCLYMSKKGVMTLLFNSQLQ